MIPSSPVHKQWSPQNDVYCEDVVQEFSTLLGAEMYVDLTKLRQISRYGIPDELRGDVWKYLLKVESADRTKDMETYKLNEAEYFQLRLQTHEYTNKIRGEVSRLQNRIQKPLTSKLYEDVIGAYLNYNKQAEFNPGWVHLCTPFVLVLEREVEVFYCFKNLMQTMDDYFYTNPLEKQLTRFQTLFRMLIPDLNDYFEEEQVSLFEWTTSWLTNLFSKEMPPATLIPLWDLYFGTTNFMDLHLYMCIAILQQNRERLEELENSEIKAFLTRLPEMDIFSIRQIATDLQHQAMETLADQL